jgi:hypothetical protein
MVSVAALAIGAALCGVVYAQRSRLYERTVTGMLALETTATPQRSKGLEAFLLHILARRTGEQSMEKILGDVTLDPTFAKALAEAVGAIAAADQCASAEKTKQDEARHQECPAVNGSTKYRLAKDGGTTKETIVTDEMKQGFLFVPVPIIRNAQLATNHPPDDLMNGDQGLKRDARISAAAAKALEDVSAAHIHTDPGGAQQAAEEPFRMIVSSVSLPPAQVYLVTTTGTTRIFNSEYRGVANHRQLESYYAAQFPASTFFPSRPYFAAAIQDGIKGPITGGAKLPTVFSITGPYLDLAGKGLVVTLSRPIFGTAFTGVVCVDLLVLSEGEMAAELERGIEEFSGVPLQQAFDFPASGGPSAFGSVPEEGSKQDLVDRWQAKFKEMKARADVFGNILGISTGDTILGSVPLSSKTDQRGNVSGNFLLFKLNLAKFRLYTTFIGLCAIVLIGGALSVVGYRWLLEVRSQRDYQLALERVAGMMADAPVPFAKLDKTDRMAFANRSFIRMIGFNSLEEIRTEYATFRSLCAAASRETYDAVNAARKADRNVDPYVVHLNTSAGTSLPVRIHSASVPGIEGHLPDTFGLVIRTDDQGSGNGATSAVPPSVSARDASAPSLTGSGAFGATERCYQVFVSSTFDDLRAERTAVAQELLRCGHLPAGMENFTAHDDRGWNVIEGTLKTTDYYVLVIAGRYGSVDPKTGISWTEREYRRARELKIPVLAFVRERRSISATDLDEGEKLERVTTFAAEVRNSVLRETWTSQDDLRAKVSTALSKMIRNDEALGKPRVGWRRG